MMYRVAERIADMEGTEGIVTGDAVGEQASQTLRNLRVLTTAAVKYPIHRPLLGFDKAETEQIARKIGTYEVSIQRAGECTAVPRKPTTSTNPQKLTETEKELNIEELVERSINSLRIINL
jgi:thiamine biosynthesis protein ThiI